MKLEEFIKETDALTYINALKVTQSEIKNEVSGIEEMIEYIVQSSERVRKLIRKADNQYRLIAKLVQQTSGSFSSSNITFEEDDISEDIKDIMEE